VFLVHTIKPAFLSVVWPCLCCPARLSVCTQTLRSPTFIITLSPLLDCLGWTDRRWLTGNMSDIMVTLNSKDSTSAVPVRPGPPMIMIVSFLIKAALFLRGQQSVISTHELPSQIARIFQVLDSQTLRFENMVCRQAHVSAPRTSCMGRDVTVTMIGPYIYWEHMSRVSSWSLMT